MQPRPSALNRCEHLPVAVRLAGVGDLEAADAGKPDCYGKVALSRFCF